MDLRTILEPPETPRYAGAMADWRVVEEILEMALPMDFKILINSYGAGSFANFLFPFSPFALRLLRFDGYCLREKNESCNI